MRIFYCPECGKEEIKDVYPPRNEITFTNIRGGYGRPITHYKCECGNLLAGSMDISEWNNKDAIRYDKDIITCYNRGGCCYPNGLYEKIEENYNNRLNLRGKKL